MTNLATSLRAWVEQNCPESMFDPGMEYSDEPTRKGNKVHLLARLDVFATAWEDRKGGRCINCEGAAPQPEHLKLNHESRGSDGDELSTSKTEGERDSTEAPHDPLAGSEPADSLPLVPAPPEPQQEYSSGYNGLLTPEESTARLNAMADESDRLASEAEKQDIRVNAKQDAIEWRLDAYAIREALRAAAARSQE